MLDNRQPHHSLYYNDGVTLEPRTEAPTHRETTELVANTQYLMFHDDKMSLMVYEGYHKFNDWLTQYHEYFIIRYRSEHHNDVEECISCANWVREKTQTKYPHNMSMKVTITLCSDKEEIFRLSKGRSLGYSIVSSNRADIYIVHSSWRGNWETFKELDYPFRRVLNHEYVHCPFWQDRASAKLSGGYPDNVLPSWFNQGIAEYISENYFDSWERHVKECVNEGKFDVDNEYAWGIYILEFMYEEFSQECVINLIRSTSPSFWGAVQTEFGVSRHDFEQGWNQYLLEKFSRLD